MRRINLNPRIQRLERQARLRRRWDAVYAEIARRQQEGRKRVAEWRQRQEAEAENAA